MKTSLLKNIRQGGNPKGGKLNYRVVTFLACLLLATALWFMNALSKNYDEQLKFYVSYENLPKDKYPSSYTVQVKVNASGYRIMGYKLGINAPNIKLDASQFRHNSYYAFTTQKHTEKLQEQLGEAIQINEILPDTLFLHNQPVNNDAN
ncbi:MAG TPA: hypothetical protein VNY36_09655 [Bacteroidia bacterium]|jgi:hypothetical protein|nr:hypothetical protein [Bacteroidia bacterium]